MPDGAELLTGNDPVLIDGGLATQCESMGCDIDHPLWSAMLLLENPRALVDASRVFLDAGARIIATASYQASRGGLMAEGLSAEDADRAISKSVTLAARARDEYLADTPGARDKPLVAASCGPWGAAQHDGSEYTGRYLAGREELVEFHRARFELFSRSPADLIACETIPNLEEAGVLCELLADSRLPAWVSFCCRDDSQLSDGTPIEAAARLFAGHPRVFAVGVNCTAPQFITPLIRRVRDAAPDKRIIVYPNSGEVYEVADNSWQGDAETIDWGGAAREWIDTGASLVGGCCRMGPAEIHAMAASGAFTR